MSKYSYIGSVEREVEIKDKYVEGKPTGRPGRADIGITMMGITYLWEVKPWSYRDDPKKRTSAQDQLAGYVDSNADFKTGGNQIEGGTAARSFTRVREGAIEEVTYEITYIVESDGLIFYKFERSSKKSQKQEQEETQQVPVAFPEKENAIEDITSWENPSPEVCMDPVQIGLLMAFATGWKDINDKINSNPDAANSVSAAISAGCQMFIVAVGANLTLMLTNPEEVNAAEVNTAIDDFMTLIEVFGGEEYLEQFMQALSENDEEAIDELIKQIQGEADEYEKAGEAQPPRDPLIIDLGEKGIKLHNVKNGVYFDLDNNGFAEKTAWIDVEDGFLSLDRNGNGKIDNGGELFGDQVILLDGSTSASGFEALEELDENQDQVIDQEDSAFIKLLVWIDADHNGKSKGEELHTLEELGIVSISLEHVENSVIDEETGARIAESAKVTIQKTENKLEETEISEFWFPVNTSDTTHGSTVTAGNVPDLDSAIQRDESGTLYELCCSFAESDDIAYKRFCTKEILYYLTDASDLKPNSRGGNIDARDLKVIEEFMGRKFEGVGGTNPNTNAAQLLKEIYNRIEDDYYNILNLYSKFGVYLKLVFEYQDENGNTKLNFLPLNTLIQSKIEKGENADTLVYDLGMYLRAYDRINGTKHYEEFSKEYSEISEHYRHIVNLSGSGNTYIGTEGDDVYQGTDANEFISGKGGDDTLSGGGGNDSLSGGDGDDTYIFAKGFGNDTMTDNSGQNTIRFQGLNSEDILVNGTGDNNVTVRIKETNDTLVIQDFCKGEQYQNFMLEFSDTKVHAADPESPFRYIYGGDSEDSLKAVLDGSVIYGFEGNDTLHGRDGDDLIYGNEGDDIIYAAAGDDIVRGGDGNDILDAGKGKDFLYGGAGDDTYVFGKEYGVDIVADEEGTSVIRLAGELTLEDIDMVSLGENAVISIRNTEDRMILADYKNHTESFILEVGGQEALISDYIMGAGEEFLTGTAQGDYIENNGKSFVAGDCGEDRIIGTEADEWIFGDAGNDQILSGDGNDVIYAGSGDDYVNSGAGDDFVDGGSGNDFLDGGEGNDIYCFYPGAGMDSIKDSQGENKIIFGDGITADKIKAKRSNWNDLKIYFDGFADTLTLKDYCVNEEARNFTLAFADGTVVHAADEKSPLKNIQGEDDSEYMENIYDDGVSLNGEDGNDNLVGGDSDDYLFGGKGDDRLVGNAGNDILDGGEGNDHLEGGAGDDTYIFKNGYGTDTIKDGEGTNTIEIHDYTSDQIKAYRTNWNNITITFENTEDSIVIEGFCIAETNRNFYLVFDDGTKIHANAEQSPLRTVYGTDDAESIFAMDDMGVTIVAEGGNDYLNGGNGADNLYGQAGDDQLWGNDGNDVLDGGTGNDELYGGAGNDTYVFGKGYGMDTVIDSEGNNILSFGEGVMLEQLEFERTNWNNLTISLTGTEGKDQIVIRDFFVSENSRRFHVYFADGTRFTYDSEENPLVSAYLELK